MLTPIVAILAFEAEMLIEYIFMSNVSEKRWHSAFSLTAGFFLFGLGAYVNLLSHNNIVINFLMTILLYLLFSLLCFRITVSSCGLYCTILCALSVTLEGAVVLAVSAFTQGQPKDYNEFPMLAVFYIVISKMLYFVTALLMAKIAAAFKGVKRHSLIIVLYPVSTLISFIALHYICVREDISSQGQYMIAIVTGIMFIATLLIVLAHQKRSEQDNEFIRMQGEFRRLQMEKSYYDFLEDQNRQLMIYAHDVKNHLAAIQALNTDPRIGGYVMKLSDRLDSYTKNSHSGNILLDVMINKYVIDCNRCGVSFDYNVKLYNLSDIEDMDLVSILGNLMDNALEAAKKSSAKEIYLETTLRNTYRVLLIRNSSLPPQRNNGNLVTSKGDFSLHGFGLKSVAQTLKKYEGDLQWDYDESCNVFTMTVMIGTPQKEAAVHT